jgi:hypothetical protein
LRLHFGHQTRILHWCTDQSITRALEEMDLTSSQGHIMGFLAHQKTAPCPKDVEEAFHLSHPTVSGLLARLEKIPGFTTLVLSVNTQNNLPFLKCSSLVF